MPQTIQLDMIPAGYAATSSRQEGDKIDVHVAGVTTSDDGLDMIMHLDGISEAYLPKLSHKFAESQIDNFLAIIHGDKSAIVYVNELNFRNSVQVRRSIKAGEEVYSTDIADVLEVSAESNQIPRSRVGSCGSRIVQT